MHLLTTLRNAISTAEAQLKKFFGGDAAGSVAPHPVIDAQAEFMKATHDAIANLTNRVAVLEDGAHATVPHPILAAGNQGASLAQLQGRTVKPQIGGSNAPLENSDPPEETSTDATAPAPGGDLQGGGDAPKT